MARGQPQGAEITSFPGWTGPPPSKTYGGYIGIPGTGKQLYYAFVTSLREPATDPVVLWCAPRS